MKRVWNVTGEHHGCFSCASTDLAGICCFFAFLPFSESAQDSVELGSGAWESCADRSHEDLSGRASPRGTAKYNRAGSPKS